MENKESNMLEEKAWEEFRETGLLMFVNFFLQIFGWSICIYYDKNKETGELRDYRVYPARSKFRGFGVESQQRAFIKLSEWMDKAHKELLEEAKS